MKQRHPVTNPEVAPHDLECPSTPKVGGGKPISLGVPPNIQPYQPGGPGRSAKKHSISTDNLKKAGAIAGAVWLGGVLLGYELLWPLYLPFYLIDVLLSTPPFSWLFGWITTPLGWVFSRAHRGAPVVEQLGALQEMRLPTDQVSVYLDTYTQKYGDAALIFATHDGYPQIVNALLFNRDLGYRDLIDSTDENGNTALLYAAARGFRQCTAALLRSSADPDVANQGHGGRTPLMEAAGAGHKDIVSAIRLSNATIDAVDDFGNTALHYAAYQGHLSVVHELLKSNPRRDIKNSLGKTAANYAQSNRHTAITDVLNRPPTKRQKASTSEAAAPTIEDVGSSTGAATGKKATGASKDRHKSDEELEPQEEKLTTGLTDTDRMSLEDQIAKLNRLNEEAELKAQKKIVELLEKSSSQQKAIDEAERRVREVRLNATELRLKVQDLESKHQSSRLRELDEKERVERFQQEMDRAELEVERHKARADAAEKERDSHIDASKRHEENLQRKHQELSEHLSRIEQQAQELNTLREDLRRQEQLARQHQDTISELRGVAHSAAGGGSSSPSGTGVEAAAPQVPSAAAAVAPLAASATAAAEPTATTAAQAPVAEAPPAATAAPTSEVPLAASAAPVPGGSSDGGQK